MQCFRSAPRKCIFRGSAPRAAAATAVAALKLELACALIASNHYKILVWKAVRRFGRQRFFLVLACSCEPRPACSVSSGQPCSFAKRKLSYGGLPFAPSGQRRKAQVRDCEPHERPAAERPQRVSHLALLSLSGREPFCSPLKGLNG